MAKYVDFDDIEYLLTLIKDTFVMKGEGKDLSENNFSDEYKAKLDSIEAGAQVNSIEGVAVNTELSPIVDKIVDLRVPTKVSQLINDEHFIDKTVTDLLNYYKKNQVYTKVEVDGLLSAMASASLQKVDRLPTSNISTSTIYLVYKETQEGDDNIYNEYIYVDGEWELIGTTKIDLTNYLQKDGDGSNLTVEFDSIVEGTLPVSGEKLATIMGKLVKVIGDIKPVAFTGDYEDLINKPQETVQTKAILAAGETSVRVEVSGVVSSYAKDAVTGEIVIVDTTITDKGCLFEIAEPYSNDINIMVSSLV